jgi:phosphatidylinositol-3-phosphatase
VLIASLGFGSSGADAEPTLTAPAAWTLVTKTNKDPVATLAVFRHVYAAGETSYTWTTRAWLRQWVPVIADSPAYKKDDLLLVLFDESDGSGAGCCNQAKFPNVTNNGGPTPGLGGGRVGGVALSPFIRPGTVSQTPYNHFSTLRTLQSMWGLPLLGYAASPNPGMFGRDVFTAGS